LKKTKKLKFLFLILFIVSLFCFNLKARDQNEADIARALTNRLTGHLEFENEEDMPVNVLINVRNKMKQIFLDSILIDPDNITYKKINGNYTLVDGNHRILNFGINRNAAYWAKRIIKHYKMNRICFIGRPNPSLTFFLCPGETILEKTSFYKTILLGKAPFGKFPFPSSDFIHVPREITNFSLKNLNIKEHRGVYTITDGKKDLFKFSDKNEVIAAFVFIKIYGFNQKCVIEKPPHSFTYLTKRSLKFRTVK